MVTLNKIYTRTGDGGKTRLATGETVSKTDPRVEAYGAVDEANSFLGLAREAVDDPELKAFLERIQNDMFDLGADLAAVHRDDLEFEPLRATQEQVDALEREIDRLNGDLQPLKSFVLPGGSDANARLHIARAVTRRAERRAMALAADPENHINPAATKYLNRLSDFLFVAARWVARDGSETLWRPGANR